MFNLKAIFESCSLKVILEKRPEVTNDLEKGLSCEI